MIQEPLPNAEAPLQQEREAAEGYRVRLQAFEGPLDLLLHLVRVNEVDITDIPIVEITEQYNAYLDLMRELSLEIAGDYLVLAATLMHIKSRMLLPPDPAAAGEEPSVDPRTELAQQLLEHERFRQAAEGLQAMESRRSLIWTRPDVAAEFAGEELLAVDLHDLLRAFHQLLQRLGEEARIRLKRDTVSVAEKISWLTERLQRDRPESLLVLLAELPTRLERIATFLAVLEMMRLQLLGAFQKGPLGEIHLVLLSYEPPAENNDQASGDPA